MSIVCNNCSITDSQKTYFPLKDNSGYYYGIAGCDNCPVFSCTLTAPVITTDADHTTKLKINNTTYNFTCAGNIYYHQGSSSDVRASYVIETTNSRGIKINNCTICGSKTFSCYSCAIPKGVYSSVQLWCFLCNLTKKYLVKN